MTTHSKRSASLTAEVSYSIVAGNVLGALNELTLMHATTGTVNSTGATRWLTLGFSFCRVRVYMSLNTV